MHLDDGDTPSSRTIILYSVTTYLKYCIANDGLPCKNDQEDIPWGMHLPMNKYQECNASNLY